MASRRLRPDGLTERQHEVLAIICRHLDETGALPTLHDWQARYGFLGSSGLKYHLDTLVRKGWVALGPGPVVQAIRVLRRPSGIWHETSAGSEAAE